MSSRNGQSYADFIRSKDVPDTKFGFEPIELPDCLFEFQNHLVSWAIGKGRAAIFADCGLGKSLMELVYAQNCLEKTNKPVLLLTPLAVGSQMVLEGKKFGIECKQVRDGRVRKGINVTNYQQLHRFTASDFQTVICDESSAIKHDTSKTRRAVTDFLKSVPYRLLATATPSPNDYMELGTSSEALGNMGRGQMLGMFFSNGGETTQQWELKGHAKKRFWRWVCSWARACRKPSDLGFDDTGYILPPLTTRQHVVESPEGVRDGFAFVGAATLDEQRQERRLTIKQRCEKVAEIVPKNDYVVVWCHMNAEGDLLEKLIPGSVQVAGKDRDEVKEERLTAFASGEIKTLITKPKIACHGLNWQHCNFMTTFPSHSMESLYQSIRRCWRFGQLRPVQLHIVTSEAESAVVANMQRKEKAMGIMFEQLVAEMHDYQLNGKQKETFVRGQLPNWL